MIESFKYEGGYAPEGYACGQCARHGCKLWRWYQIFLDHQALFCAECAAKNQGHAITDLDDKGMSSSEATKHDGQKSSSIGWLVPAVPTENGETYWGYTSVPDDGVAWWRALPTRIP